MPMAMIAFTADGPSAAVVRRLTEVQDGEDFGKLVEQIASHRAGFQTPLTAAEIWPLFGLAVGFTLGDILSDVFFGDEAVWMSGVVSILAGGSKTDAKAAETLRVLDLRRYEHKDQEGPDGTVDSA